MLKVIEEMKHNLYKNPAIKKYLINNKNTTI
jgi:hypothetical protein